MHQKLITLIATLVCVKYLGGEENIPVPMLSLSQTETSSPSDADDDEVQFSCDIESKNLQPFTSFRTELFGT